MRLSLTRGARTGTAPAAVATSRGSWNPLRTTSRCPFSSTSSRVGLDVGGDLGQQRRGEHLPRAVAGELVEQRPTDGRRDVLLGLVLLVDYLEHGRTFPSRRANADLDPNLSMGFDLAREVRLFYVTSPRAIHRF